MQLVMTQACCRQMLSRLRKLLSHPFCYTVWQWQPPHKPVVSIMQFVLLIIYIIVFSFAYAFQYFSKNGRVLHSGSWVPPRVTGCVFFPPLLFCP